MRFLQCKQEEKAPPTGRRVAVIGAGPAGLAAAGTLVCKGHEVHVFDKMPEPGGLLIFGIPAFRLPKEGIRRGVSELKEAGVRFHLGVEVGKDVPLGEILRSHDAVLIATGTWRTQRLGVPGSDLKGVYPALEWIVDYNMAWHGYKRKEEVPELGDAVAVIGGGLTAVDACLIALREGVKEVILIYRRTREYAPAGKKEFDSLEERGVSIRELTQPVEYLGDGGRVRAIKAIKMRLERVGEGRPRPVPVPGSEHVIHVSAVIEATGLEPTPPAGLEEQGIQLNPDGTIKTDDRYRTTRRGVFAAGDVRHGASLIGPAFKSGVEAARSIDEYLATGRW